MKRTIGLSLLWATAAGLAVSGPVVWAQAPEENLAVLDGWVGHLDAPHSLYRTLFREARAQLAARAEHVAQLETAEDWRARQERVRQLLLEMFGPFPERTSLNARTVGVLQKDGYRVEKLVYESMPEVYVTAALFIPDDLDGPAPGILYSSGHTEPAFRSPQYQTVILNLVRKGFVVLAYDPISQGERLQYYETGMRDSRVGPPSREHSYAGAQGFVAGVPLHRYMIWDGIRGVDYLLSRDEVDPDRIGAHGRSGGGTQTALIAAVDARIRASATEAWLTTLSRLLESIGPQDSEQIFPGAPPAGLDLADFVTVRAPRPGLIVATTRDIFSIDGTREVYREARRAYAALGAPDAIGLAEADQIHATALENREAVYRFFQDALDQPGDPREETVDLVDPAELRVTETGQVATSLGGKTVFDLVQDELGPGLARLEEERARSTAAELAERVEAARDLAAFEPPTSAPAVFTGRYRRDGYAVERYFLEAPDYPIPFLLFVPDTPGPHPGFVYLDPEGKESRAGRGGRLEDLVRQGYAVLAPDVVGMGELGPGAYEGHGYEFRVGRGSYAIWHMAVFQGRSLVGMRAMDAARCVAFLSDHPDVEGEGVTLLGEGGLATVALHAAAFDETIRRLVLVEPLLSYEAVVASRYYDPGLIHETVAGALPRYDLPDLVASLDPRPVLLVDPRNELGRPASRDEFGAAYPEPLRRGLTLSRTGLWEDAWAGILDWLR
jgi:cephalosporin-C deacetylase-like acetyl esterase